MDASALLTRQGWRGKGHALDRAGLGVKKPLLVSQKSNTFGLGKKRVDVQADQWWARAFDAGLKNLDVNGSGGKNDTPVVVVKGVEGRNTKKDTKVSELSLLANGGRKWLGLYDGFVRGEGLEGTIGRRAVACVVGSGDKIVKNRAEEEQVMVCGNEERRARKEKKKRRREQGDKNKFSVDHDGQSIPEISQGMGLVTTTAQSTNLGMADDAELPAKRKKKRKHKAHDMSAD